MRPANPRRKGDPMILNFDNANCDYSAYTGKAIEIKDKLISDSEQAAATQNRNQSAAVNANAAEPQSCRSGKTAQPGATAEPDMTGWVTWPTDITAELLNRIKDTALEIKNKCGLFIIVGIGGSFLGSKAIIDALLRHQKANWPEIAYAGTDMSAAYLERLYKRMDKEDVCLCGISKSGGTLETVLSYSLLKEKMISKYGDQGAYERIYIITGKNDGKLASEATAHGITTFEVPENIGGRYSVLTPVGLLPIAAAGYDIKALIKGSAAMASEFKTNSSLTQYAACRIALQNSGKSVEVFEYFEHDLRYFGEWLKQLFGESEGKDGKGAFPACLYFTRDLHSIGQFLQQGNQIFSETIISIESHKFDYTIPEFAGDPYSGKTLEQVNSCAEEGVIKAHAQSGIPIVKITVPCIDEYNVGQLIYFFEMSAAISAYLLELNPFDQPGVEAYKKASKDLISML